jgi:drug/metabolite transporter (DMT)-like permease
MEKNNILKVIGAFIFVFGIFFLLLSITNIFNDIDFMDQYSNCIEVSKYQPEILDICKENVSEGLGIAIRTNQVEFTTGQYLKIYIRQIINVLLAVLLIILGDFLYISSKRKKTETKETKVKAIVKPTTKKKKVVRKKKK